MTREEAIGNLTHAIRWNDMPKKEALNMAIKALEQEPRWIPVSESLPEEDGEYFVTWITSRVDIPLLGICVYSCGEWDIDNGCADSDAQVIAWMPLPEPYKAESEDRECR